MCPPCPASLAGNRHCQPRGNYSSKLQSLYTRCLDLQFTRRRQNCSIYSLSMSGFQGLFLSIEKDKAFISAEATPNLTESGNRPACLQRWSLPPKNTETHESLSNRASAPEKKTAQPLNGAALAHLHARSPAACSLTVPPGGSGWTGYS